MKLVAHLRSRRSGGAGAGCCGGGGVSCHAHALGGRLRMRRLVLVLLLLTLPTPAFGLTAFYLDPAVAAGGAGTQASPWKGITGNWPTVNAALATGDVTVYCSARQASSDTNSQWAEAVDLTPKANSSFRLTFDGRSFWHQSGSSWPAQTGNGRCQVQGFSAVGDSAKHSNVTIDGFFAVQAGGSLGWGGTVIICGDNWVVQNNDISFGGTGTTPGSPGILMMPSADAAHEGASPACPPSTNIQILNNKVHDTTAMNIYIGGGGCSQPFDVDAQRFDVANNHCQTSATNPTSLSHSNILIQGNNVYNCVSMGPGHGQAGDTACVGFKGALSGVTFRQNEVHNEAGGPVQNCLHSSGTTTANSGAGFTTAVQNHVFERNYFHDCPNNAANGYAAIELDNTWGTPNGVVFRNNIFARITAGTSPASCLRVEDAQSSGVQFYNNTVYSCNDVALLITRSGPNYNGAITYQNNAILNPGHPDTSLSGLVVADHNAYDGSWSGTCTSCVSGLTSADFVNVSGANFTPSATSKLREVGVNLNTLFTTDYNNNTRGPVWDIGAIQVTAAASPTSPQNLQLLFLEGTRYMAAAYECYLDQQSAQ